MSPHVEGARRLTDYAIAFEFMTKLASAMTEQGVVENAFELFQQLFAPSAIVYASIQDGEVVDVVARAPAGFDVGAAKASMTLLATDHARTPSGKGFDVKVGSAPTYAVIRVEDVRFVEYLDHYLNLTLAVAPVLGLALTNARTYQSLQDEQRRQRFLAEAGVVLGASLDAKETLRALAEVTVEEMADLCVVDLVEADGLPVRLQAVHADPTKAHACRVLEGVRLEDANIARTAIETASPHLVSEVTEDYLQSVAQSPEHLSALRELDPKSVLSVPILLRGRLLGTLTLATSRTTRRYRPADVAVAEELARRTAFALENARLYEIARRATRARDDVLGVVAHDLRNPLAAIVMATKLLRRHGAEPERRSSKPVERIERAAKRMQRLIDDLLDVARMDAGQLCVDCDRVSAGSLVREAIVAQGALTSEASIALVDELPSALPDVWADHDRVLQVFENLVGNAVKFTQPGGRIVVGAEQRGDDVIFRVEDSGAGIEPESQSHLFDRFWQAKRTGRVGAGLGLAIAKGIVESHGGRIWVESTPGQGAAFYFTVPVAGSRTRASAPLSRSA